MNKPSGLLFDLDGTLLDTARDLGNALNFVLDKHALPLCTYEQYRAVASHGSNGLLNLGFGELLVEYDLNILRKELLDYYYANICVDTIPFDGVDELIDEMNKASLPWGIVTNKPGWLTDSLIPNFEQFNSCKILLSGDSLEQRKPHPEPLLHAANALNKAAEDLWYIGDAERDIQAANAANMTSVLADYGYIAKSDDPDSWSADISIKHASALIPLIA